MDQGARQVENLYLLARLFDRGYAVLGRDMPDELQRSLTLLSLDRLDALVNAFAARDETLLAAKLRQHVQARREGPVSHSGLLTVISQHIDPMARKLRRANAVDAETAAALPSLCRRFLGALPLAAQGEEAPAQPKAMA
jgi:hypothetical protein